MNSTQRTATSVAVAADEMSAREVLDLARSHQRAEDAAAARKLEAAAWWADLHPPESIHSAASYVLAGIEHEEPIAGPGCPAVAQFCIAELGAVLGISTPAAARLIGHALELRHRLPRLWAAVHSGRVPAWRARLVAEATIHATPALTPDSVGWIDRQITPYAAKVGPAQLDRLVTEAIARQQPADHLDPDDPHPVCPDTRHVTIDASQVAYAGTTQITAELDLADALDLDHALRTGAAELRLSAPPSPSPPAARSRWDTWPDTSWPSTLLADPQVRPRIRRITRLTCPPPGHWSCTCTSTPGSPAISPSTRSVGWKGASGCCSSKR